MKILVSGSSGLIGSELVAALIEEDHEVVRLVRTKPVDGELRVSWDPESRQLDASLLGGLDAVVHLAGENVATRRWTPAQKKRIRGSRVEGTRFLCETLAQLKNPPKVLVSASAIGYYGDRGDEILDESSPPGSGFLADICRDWEAATRPASDHRIRVVQLRFGIVLSAHGGPLAKMLPPFRFGLGGVVGSGRQYISWIAIEDAMRVIRMALVAENLRGPANAVSPSPVTNREFTKALGHVLHRPTLFPLPAFAAKLVLGEMGKELLLASTRVSPRKLLEAGFEFRHPDLEGALRHVLGK